MQTIQEVCGNECISNGPLICQFQKVANTVRNKSSTYTPSTFRWKFWISAMQHSKRWWIGICGFRSNFHARVPSSNLRTEDSYVAQIISFISSCVARSCESSLTTKMEWLKRSKDVSALTSREKSLNPLLHLKIPFDDRNPYTASAFVASFETNYWENTYISWESMIWNRFWLLYNFDAKTFFRLPLSGFCMASFVNGNVLF